MQILDQYEILQILGKGTFGDIYQVKDKQTHEIAVIKRVSLHNLPIKDRQEALRESQLMQRLHHPHIIEYYTSFIEDNMLYIVMEYASNGDLSQLIQHRKNAQTSFGRDEIWNLLTQIASAILYLHDRNIIHRDIKTSNIFLDQENNVKLGDFGLGCLVDPQSGGFAQTSVGTPYYLSPELCQEQKYNSKTDIWSLGCLVYEITSFRPPFEASNHLALAHKIVYEDPASLLSSSTKDAGQLAFLISKMLQKDMNKRPSIQQVLEYISIHHKMQDATPTFCPKASSIHDEELRYQIHKTEQQFIQEKETLVKNIKRLQNEMDTFKKVKASELLGTVQDIKSSFRHLRSEILQDFQSWKDQHRQTRDYVASVFAPKLPPRPLSLAGKTIHHSRQWDSSPIPFHLEDDTSEEHHNTPRKSSSVMVKILRSEKRCLLNSFQLGLTSAASAQSIEPFEVLSHWSHGSPRVMPSRIQFQLDSVTSGILVICFTKRHHVDSCALFHSFQIHLESNARQYIALPVPIRLSLSRTDESSQGVVYEIPSTDLRYQSIQALEIIPTDKFHHLVDKISLLPHDRRFLELAACSPAEREQLQWKTTSQQGVVYQDKENHPVCYQERTHVVTQCFKK